MSQVDNSQASLEINEKSKSLESSLGGLGFIYKPTKNEQGIKYYFYKNDKSDENSQIWFEIYPDNLLILRGAFSSSILHFPKFSDQDDIKDTLPSVVNFPLGTIESIDKDNINNILSSALKNCQNFNKIFDYKARYISIIGHLMKKLNKDSREYGKAFNDSLSTPELKKQRRIKIESFFKTFSNSYKDLMELVTLDCIKNSYTHDGITPDLIKTFDSNFLKEKFPNEFKNGFDQKTAVDIAWDFSNNVKNNNLKINNLDQLLIDAKNKLKTLKACENIDDSQELIDKSFDALKGMYDELNLKPEYASNLEKEFAQSCNQKNTNEQQKMTTKHKICCGLFMLAIVATIAVLAYFEFLLIGAAVTAGLTGLLCLTVGCCLEFDSRKNNHPANVIS